MLEDDIISSKDYLRIIFEVRFCKNMNFNEVLFYLIITVMRKILICSLLSIPGFPKLCAAAHCCAVKRIKVCRRIFVF